MKLYFLFVSFSLVQIYGIVMARIFSCSTVKVKRSGHNIVIDKKYFLISIPEKWSDAFDVEGNINHVV